MILQESQIGDGVYSFVMLGLEHNLPNFPVILLNQGNNFPNSEILGVIMDQNKVIHPWFNGALSMW